MIDGYKFVLDISYYQQAMDWMYLKNILDGFVFRITYGTHKDTKFKEHTKKALDAGYTHLAGYAWLRPDQDIKNQLSSIREQLYGTPISFVFVDIEQHGRGYQNFPPHYSGEELSDKVWQMVSGLTTIGLTPGIYTRSTWVEEYAKPLKTWMYKYPVWLASYPFAGGRISLSWEELMEKYAPKIFSPFYHRKWGSNLKKARMWQWSGDKFVLPGVFSNEQKTRNMPVDLNYVENDLYEMFKIGEEKDPVPQPPIQEYETWKCFSPLGMVVRNSPSRSGVDTRKRIRFNEAFNVYEKVSSDGLLWGRIDSNMWVALNWSKLQTGELQPPPSPEYELWQCKATLGMIIRDSPSGKDTGKRLLYNETFKVYEKRFSDNHNWGRIGTNKWVALTWSVPI